MPENVIHKDFMSIARFLLTHSSKNANSYKVFTGDNCDDKLLTNSIELSKMDNPEFGTPDLIIQERDNIKNTVIVKIVDNTNTSILTDIKNYTSNIFKMLNAEHYDACYAVVKISNEYGITIDYINMYYTDESGLNKNYMVPMNIEKHLDVLFDGAVNHGKANSELSKLINDERKNKILGIEQFIWSTADLIRGVFRESDYSDVILPLTLMTRLDAVLDSTRSNVINEYNRIADIDMPESDKDALLKHASNNHFYNTSGYTLEDVYRNADAETFLDYIDGFSANIREILDRLDIDKTVYKLEEADIIDSVVYGFYSHREELKNLEQADIGTLFENLIRRFSEKDNDGEHFTSTDIVRLCCYILMDGAKDAMINQPDTYTVYDQAMGTSQMLTEMKNLVEGLNSDNVVNIYGQELNPKTWALARSSEIMKRNYSDDDIYESNLELGNTITNDKFKFDKFDYAISNPPFGVKWDMYNFDASSDPRYAGIGTPAKSDGQMLFTLNGLYHLNNNGRMTIIHNGSPLFSGQPGSGEASIREYLIKNDYIEAIIKLPNDLFYNTGITTYIWVITKNKRDYRKGKIQLIDANNIFSKLRKSQGSRKNEITQECRDLIFKAYEEFKDNETYALESNDSKTLVSKIFDNEYFKGEPDAQGRYKWEIPFDKLFYVAEEKQDSESIKQRIIKLNAKIQAGMTELFGNSDN